MHYFNEEEDRCATPSEACREFAYAVGFDNMAAGREQPAWILTNWDSWERNPFYTGPAVRHPLDDEYPDSDELAEDVLVVLDHDTSLLVYADGGHLIVREEVHIYPMFLNGLYWVTTSLANAFDGITLPMLHDDFGNLVDLP